VAGRAILSLVHVDAAELKQLGRDAGLDAVGIAPAEPFVGTRVHLHDRRAAGLHGGMQFTYRNPDRSTDPDRALRGARAIVVGARAYPSRTRDTGDRRLRGRVAAYARDDHYATLRCGLAMIADRLCEVGWHARVLVDDNALVDREAAYRAGLGWYGKNSNVLLPGRGSWFVLGSVVTTAPLEPDEAPMADGCGACRRCISGCPTGAIVAPGVVDARHCLAWLLQMTGEFPREHRVALGDRIYGCDDCQEVCPQNADADRDAGQSAEPWVSILEMLTVDDAALLARHGRWYIPERAPRYLRRNALVVLGNIGDARDPTVVRLVERYLDDPDPMLRSHAAWAARRLGRQDLLVARASDAAIAVELAAPAPLPR
jgi:epoxyqueuosine reductase